MVESRYRRVVALGILACALAMAACGPSQTRTGDAVAAATEGPEAPSGTSPSPIPTAVPPSATPDPAWAALSRRALVPVNADVGRCPTPPPKSVSAAVARVAGQGPAYTTLGTESLSYTRLDNGWYGLKTIWLIAAPYDGRVLVRGFEVGGAREVAFDDATRPVSEMHIRSGPTGFSTGALEPGWRLFVTDTLVRGSGYYALQVDGESFSYTIVFEVID